MKIIGSIKNNGKIFDFSATPETDSEFHENHIYTFSYKKIFIYIDGRISKLSKKVIEISKSYESIEEKIAYLYSINFSLESHIFGSFNIFLYDFNEKSFKAIRDTRGTRSLFYAIDDDKFFFSSDLKSLLKNLKKITLNKLKLMEYLNWDYRSNKKTFFNEIDRVKPGSFLTYKGMTLTSDEYTLSREIFLQKNDDDPNRAFKEILYKAVTSLVNRKKKIGVMMSGGLDSSAIAIALKQNNYNDVKTYSANFSHVTNNSEIHEEKYQRNIENFTNYHHSAIEMEGKSPIIPIQKFTKIINQPIHFPNIYIYEEIISKLKADGIEIILDGTDGDNTVSHGFETLYIYLKQLRIIKFIKEIYLYSKFKKTSFMRLLNLFMKQAVKEALNIKIKQRKNTLLKKDIKIEKNPKNAISFFSSHKRKLSIDLHFLANEYRNDLFRYFDIENFSPFYDEDLIHFCLNMPNQNKLDNGLSRKILRDFLSNFLPIEHVKRDKSILSSGLIKNFKDSDLSIVKDEYKNINKNLIHLIDKEKIEKIIKNCENRENMNDEELINLQIFVSANTFLNSFKL